MSAAPLVDLSQSRTGRNPCTGVLLAAGYAVSARHCTSEDTAYVRAHGTGEFQEWARQWEVPMNDLVAYAPPGKVRRKKGATIAAKLSSKALARAHLFVVTRSHGLSPAELISADATYVTVVAPDASLCYGDSGSPLLVEQNGHYRVLGVLNIGAADCSPQGHNRFSRLDILADLRPLR